LPLSVNISGCIRIVKTTKRACFLLAVEQRLKKEDGNPEKIHILPLPTVLSLPLLVGLGTASSLIFRVCV
jgi:hypothetical protein